VHSSKAVGEPPFFLGASVLFALRQALSAARKDQGMEGFVELHSPATSERIRMGTGDAIARRCIESLNSGSTGEEAVQAFQAFAST